ncbi:hypothetical protein Tco_0971230 [Tanacetum coccineum]
MNRTSLEEASEDDDEEEEHPALADSSVIPVDDLVPSAEDTKAFETNEYAPTHVPSPRCYTARMSVRLEIPMSNTAEALIAEYASTSTLPSPPPSPLTSLSSLLPHIPSPPLLSSQDFLRAASLSTHHPSEIPSPPLLLPSTTYRDDLPKADMARQKRSRFTAPTCRFKDGDSSLAVARQVGHTLAHRVYYGFVDTMDTSICAYESRAMTAIGEVSLLTRERRYFSLMASSYKREAIIARQAWSHSKSRIQAMEAHIRALQRDIDVLQRQRIRHKDRLVAHIQNEHNTFKGLVRAAEVRPQDRTEDAGSSC